MPDEREGRRIALGDAARVILAGAEAFYENDHVVLTSGRHSAAYVNHDPLFEQRNHDQLSELSGLLASMIIEVVKPDTVPGAIVGPMTGGWHLAHWAGHHYRLLRDSVPSVCAEKKEGGGFFLSTRDAEQVRGQGVLLIDDVLTTGKSVRETQAVIEAAGGRVENVLVVCDRSGKTAAELGIANVWSLFTLSAQTWSEEECPMCKSGQRVNTIVGHGAEFMLKKAQP